MRTDQWLSSLSSAQIAELEALRASDRKAFRKMRLRFYMRWWSKKNPDKIRALEQKRKARLETNEEAYRNRIAKIGAWKRMNPERVSASYHRTKDKHKAHRKTVCHAYYLNNKSAIISRTVAYNKRRLKTDTKYKLKDRVRARFRELVAGKRRGARALSALGCSLEFFKQHIESLWKPGMTWDNYGVTGWHIDHKRPCCTFDLTNETQVAQCFHYTNLQPLWAEENLTKARSRYLQ